jgi:predicted DNA-binding transcriptional regulator YafY
MREALARATSKLEASLDASKRRRILQLQSRIVVPDLASRSAGTPSPMPASRDRHVARITYVELSTRAQSERDVEPLGFVCRGDAGWPVARCRLRDDTRAFRVDHVIAWQPSITVCGACRLSFGEIIARDRHLTDGLFGY